jgi:hypothetical protein
MRRAATAPPAWPVEAYRAQLLPVEARTAATARRDGAFPWRLGREAAGEPAAFSQRVRTPGGGASGDDWIDGGIGVAWAVSGGVPGITTTRVPTWTRL